MFIEQAEARIKEAREEESRLAKVKAEKVKSAEELKTKLEELQELKAAIQVVAEEEIEVLKNKIKTEIHTVDSKMKGLLQKNESFADEALRMMERAANVVHQGRQKSLFVVGRILKKAKEGINTLSDEISQGLK